MKILDIRPTSESADKPPGWWIRKGKGSRQAYIKRHPKSKWSKFLEYGLKSTKPQSSKKKPSPAGKGTKDKPVASGKGSSTKKKINEVKGKAKLKVSRSKRIKEMASKKAPLIASNLNKGLNKLVTKAPAYASKIKDSISKATSSKVGNFFKKKLTGGEVDEAEKEAVISTLTPVLKAVLGVAVLGALAVGAAPLVAALANTYSSSLDNLMTSESSELNTDEPVDLLIHDFMRWFSKIDKNVLAEKIAELQVLEEFGEGEAEESETSVEGDEEDPDFTSESAVVKRVSFRVSPLQRRVVANLRTKFEVIFDKEVVGHIESDPKIKGDGFQNRCWVVTLRDGFNESSYTSGYRSDEPFTSVRGDDVLLRNPQRMTMPEARGWVKGALVRSFL